MSTHNILKLLHFYFSAIKLNPCEQILPTGVESLDLILVFALLSFLIGSVLYASLSQVDTTISARGEFLTATPNIIVEASASSVVKSVEVERGDTVSKDQIIAYLDDTMVQVNLKQNEEKIDNIVQALISLYMEEFLVNNIQMFTDNFNLRFR